MLAHRLSSCSTTVDGIFSPCYLSRIFFPALVSLNLTPQLSIILLIMWCFLAILYMIECSRLSKAFNSTVRKRVILFCSRRNPFLKINNDAWLLLLPIQYPCAHFIRFCLTGLSNREAGQQRKTSVIYNKQVKINSSLVDSDHSKMGISGSGALGVTKDISFPSNMRGDNLFGTFFIEINRGMIFLIIGFM